MRVPRDLRSQAILSTRWKTSAWARTATRISTSTSHCDWKVTVGTACCSLIRKFCLTTSLPTRASTHVESRPPVFRRAVCWHSVLRQSNQGSLPRVCKESLAACESASFRDRHRHCKCGAIPGLLPEFDLPELALLVAPRSLQISNGANDAFSPAEAKRCLALIAPVFRTFGLKNPLMNLSPGGHEYSFDPAREFFEESLDPNQADVPIAE